MILLNLNPAQFLRIYLGFLSSIVTKLSITFKVQNQILLEKIYTIAVFIAILHLVGEVLESYLSYNPSLMLWHCSHSVI